MGASRESYKISSRLKYYSGNYFWRLKFIIIFTFQSLVNKRDRQLFLKDNFYTPFNKKYGCKLFGHKYREEYEDDGYFCTKCYKSISSKEFLNNTRTKKIKSIL